MLAIACQKVRQGYRHVLQRHMLMHVPAVVRITMIDEVIDQDIPARRIDDLIHDHDVGFVRALQGLLEDHLAAHADGDLSQQRGGREHLDAQGVDLRQLEDLGGSAYSPGEAIRRTTTPSKGLRILRRSSNASARLSSRRARA